MENLIIAEDVKCLVEEHADLIVKIDNLHTDIYSDENEDNKPEFANKCIQLASMKKYEECLRARIENRGVVFDNGNYFLHIGGITKTITRTNDENENNNSQEGE